MGVHTLHVAHIQTVHQVAIYAYRKDDSRRVCEHERDAENTDFENLQPLIACTSLW